MTKWIWQGLQTGIKTTAYPAAAETAAGVSPGRPINGSLPDTDAAIAAEAICPAAALHRVEDRIRVDNQHCIHCFRCRRRIPHPLTWDKGYEWGRSCGENPALGRTFARSLHIRIVDAGACGACLSETRQIGAPYYNIHRLGFFITPTPRAADILLVAGPVTEHMREALQCTYEAMPSPKRVVALGTCALDGGVFGSSFVSGAGVAEAIPVDIEITGCPPPPLAIIHGLLIAAGRKPATAGTALDQKRERRAAK